MLVEMHSKMHVSCAMVACRSKCSIWEGGTKGVGFLFWAGLPAAAQGLVFKGLIHAADWLPTAVAGLALRPVGADETLPLGESPMGMIWLCSHY